MKRIFLGKVWKFGDCIDSGNIKGVMAGIDPQFHLKVKPGDFIIAGINFGMGSSAEDAPRSLREAGMHLPDVDCKDGSTKNFTQIRS